MRLSLFDFTLPLDRIADRPADPRDASRLLRLPRGAGSVSHLSFRDLPGLLRAGDLLVLNDTKVLPARLIGTREATGGAVELLLLEPDGADGVWTCLAAPGRKAPRGARLRFAEGITGEVVGFGADGTRTIRFDPAEGFLSRLDRAGLMPLPPYVLSRRKASAGAGLAPSRSDRGRRELHLASDRERYQTVYARNPGSVAGATAGLHFTDGTLEALGARGVRTAFVTLHVGLATFRPIRAETLEGHRMHEERFELPAATVDAVVACKAAGGRVVAVGTTTVRVLEGVAAGAYRPDGRPGLRATSGRTDLFLRPGVEFRVVDGILTNFHLPRSSLLVLVCAFASRERVLSAYEEAIRRGYRFYSYGDAMAIL